MSTPALSNGSARRGEAGAIAGVTLLPPPVRRIFLPAIPVFTSAPVTRLLLALR